MNLKKAFGYSTGVLTLLTALGGCNGGSSNVTPNTAYGQLMSGGSAPPNPYFNYSTILPMTFGGPASLNGQFPKVAVNLNTAESGLQAVNIGYINAASNIFGLTGAESVNNFVATQAAAAQVGAAKLDAITYTAPGAPYMFGGRSVSKEVISGLVIMPMNQAGTAPLAESQIKGVILYYHPTILSKAGVPSGIGNESGDMGATFYSQFELASIYASAGYIVAATDYVGQGLDTGPAHPYVLFPETNALSGIYMLPALNQYLSESYGFNLESLAVNNRNLYISSYSEGGGYAMAATQLLNNSYANILQNTGLTLKRTVGGSGAYNLSQEMVPFAFANATNTGFTDESNYWHMSPGCDATAGGASPAVCPDVDTQALEQALAQYQIATSKPPLGSYMVNALVTYDYTPAAYDLVLNKNFYNLTTCLNPASLTDDAFGFTSCTNLGYPSNSVSTLFNLNGLDQTTIVTELFFAAAGSSVNGMGYFISNYPSTYPLIAALGSGVATNSVSPFINETLLVDPGIQALIRNADTYNITTTTPVSLLYLDYDSTITNRNSLSACSTIAANSGANLVHCQSINNTQMWADIKLPGLGAFPAYINHANMEAIMQMAAIHEITSNP